MVWDGGEFLPGKGRRLGSEKHAGKRMSLFLFTWLDRCMFFFCLPQVGQQHSDIVIESGCLFCQEFVVFVWGEVCSTLFLCGFYYCLALWLCIF